MEEKLRTGGLESLRREVLGSYLCTACGGCSSFCPYFVVRGDKVGAVGGCDLTDGRCYRACPRSAGVTGGSLGGDAGYLGPVGHVLEVHMARGLAFGASGREAFTYTYQHGGTVTALMTFALEMGFIDGAVLTRWTSDGEGYCLPENFLARTTDEVASAGGSKFAVVPTGAAVNSALKLGFKRLGVVALPCQATALRKLKISLEASGQQSGIALIVGLFCTWALGQEGWRFLIEKHVGPRAIKKADIPPPPAEIMVIELADGGSVTIPLSQVRTAVRDSCRVCLDMTAENTDISIGLVEGMDGWNTVLVRTPTGQELLSRARQAGVVELSPLDPARFAHLSEASLGKKRRAIKAALEQTQPSAYLERICTYEEEVERDLASL